ncbi:hypothetical protein HYH03_016247 [Edaphochlamys debaryana]|uniref:Uncharacterized protein n=1 Tax=Edaphochlamys debaryana TaxID=47281 RepID=A0A836BRS3_9CHLO|nr:hypothetical protein HYH03_016247 [Edaphochlamys debaryana]|eukprot:KAG2484948.1 hypothetical protein HYH03_016247 [Edaphochlamys debaryana]
MTLHPPAPYHLTEDAASAALPAPSVVGAAAAEPLPAEPPLVGAAAATGMALPAPSTGGEEAAAAPLAAALQGRGLRPMPTPTPAPRPDSTGCTSSRRSSNAVPSLRPSSWMIPAVDAVEAEVEAAAVPNPDATPHMPTANPCKSPNCSR